MAISAGRILAVSLRMQETIARRVVPQLNREFKRVAREAGKAYAEGGAAGAASVVPEHNARIKAIVDRIYQTTIPAFAGETVDQINTARKERGLAPEHKDAAFDLFEAIRAWTTEVAAMRVTQISRTTAEQINAVIAKSVGTGATTVEVSKSINTVLGGQARSRSIMIARTETHASATYGSEVGAQSTGLTLMKEWVAAEDERTRPGHAKMDGVMVPMDGVFHVGPSRDGADDAANMRRPGDPTAPAGQVVNCRCVMAYVEV